MLATGRNPFGHRGDEFGLGPAANPVGFSGEMFGA